METVILKESAIDSRPPDDSFIRIESKFLVEAAYMLGIENLLREHMKPVDGTGELGFSRIETLYLDTTDLDFFVSTLKKAPTRLKLRIRKYLTNISGEPSTYIELKSKDHGVSKKRRFRLGALDVQKVLNHETLALTPELIRLNSHLTEKKLASRIEGVNQIIENYKPTPFITIGYDRKAFESEGLRVTVDSNIQYVFHGDYSSQFDEQIANILIQDYWRLGQDMHQAFRRLHNIIIEVKHSGTIPEWLHTYLSQVANVSDASFSKYAWGMASTVIDHLSHKEGKACTR